MPKWCPVFVKDENEFIIQYEDLVFSDESTAWKAGWGTSLVEGVLLGFVFTGRSVDVEQGLINRRSKLGGMPVAVIAGPLVDEVVPREGQECGVTIASAAEVTEEEK